MSARTERKLSLESEKKMLKFDALLAFLVTLLFIMVIFSASVKSHEWYPEHCCNEKDCTDAKFVELNEDNSKLYFHTERFGVIEVPDWMMEHPTGFSPDGKYHICIDTTTDSTQILCIFVPLFNS